MTTSELKQLRERFLSNSKIIKKATASDLIHETSAQQEARIKMLLNPKNYTKFFDYYFGCNTPISLGDAPCADFHQSSYEKVFNDPFIWMIRQWYRGAAKSIHSNVGNIAHLKENDELFFALIVGKTEGQSKLLLSDLQVHLQFNERYIKDFGMQMSYGNWSDGEFETKDNRFFKALGLNQPFRGLRNLGHRIDYASWDDVEDRKAAKNKELTRESGEKITGDLGKAFDFKRGRCVGSNNYIVRGGILDHVKEKKKNSKHLVVETVNLSDENGNPSWHQRLTRADVTRIVSSDDHYTSQREDYNNPIEEGRLFKEDWIKFIKIHGNKRNWNGVLCHWDLSYKTTGDYKSGVFLGFGNGKIHVLDMFCRKCDISTAMEWHFEKIKEYEAKGLTPLCYYDATAAQEIIFSPLWHSTAKQYKSYNIPLPAHVSTDKHMRIEATLTNVFFHGTLVWDEKIKSSDDWKKEGSGKDQLLGFEKGMKINDDLPDTLEAGVRIGSSLYELTDEEAHDNAPIFTERTRGGF